MDEHKGLGLGLESCLAIKRVWTNTRYNDKNEVIIPPLRNIYGIKHNFIMYTLSGYQLFLPPYIFIRFLLSQYKLLIRSHSYPVHE